MKKFPKAGLLIVTLVIPALIFVLLKLFATNHYDLPYFLPAHNAAGEVVVQNGDTVFSKVVERCEALKPMHLEGGLTVLHQMPEPCPDGCQKAIDEVRRVAALKDVIPELKVVALTAGNAEAKQLEWAILNSAETVDCLQASGVLEAENGIVLIDRAGFVRGFYKGGDTEETDRLMAEIKILDYEQKNKVN
nr:hypothetical protein [uncultured Dyadobacter sp.]